MRSYKPLNSAAGVSSGTLNIRQSSADHSTRPVRRSRLQLPRCVIAWTSSSSSLARCAAIRLRSSRCWTRMRSTAGTNATRYPVPNVASAARLVADHAESCSAAYPTIAAKPTAKVSASSHERFTACCGPDDREQAGGDVRIVVAAVDHEHRDDDQRDGQVRELERRGVPAQRRKPPDRQDEDDDQPAAAHRSGIESEPGGTPGSEART